MGFIVGIQMGEVSGAALYRDGRIVYAASEERYSRIKNDGAFPEAVIAHIIEKYHLNDTNIDQVVLPSTHMSPVHFLTGVSHGFSIADYLREEEEYYKPRLLEGKAVDFLDVFKDKVDERYFDLYDRIKDVSDTVRMQIWNQWRKEKVSKIFGISETKITIVNHEHSHLAYAYYGSPFRGEDVLAVSFDGYSDFANAAIAVKEKDCLNIVRRYTNYNIGRIYRYITLLLKMRPGEHEFKVMGLAPYATEYNYRKALEVFESAYQFRDGEVIIDPELKDNYYYFQERLQLCRFDGIAGGLQIFTERMNRALCQYWLTKLHKRKIVLSGGVSLNIKANKCIGELPEVDDLFVMGSGGDESLCIGAIYGYLDNLGRGGEIMPLDMLYLGDDIEDADREAAVRHLHENCPVTVHENAASEEIAKQLANGKVLARVYGKMEFGARALGNRSILADPRSRKVVKRINNQIKNRDFWMPFTPSMLSEGAKKYLHNPKGFVFPYMSVACETTEQGKRDLAGAIHPADETARPQIVSDSGAYGGGYQRLLHDFAEITGVPALLNTSLNLHGYPIVRTCMDAAKVFENSDLDGMVLGNTMVMRNRDIEADK